MDNDVSTISMRSNSAKVGKIFDEFMQTIGPLKENLNYSNSDLRSNYHMSSATPDRSNRSNSQIAFIQSIQSKNKNLLGEITELKTKLKTSSDYQTLYQNLTEQYNFLEMQHKELLQKLKLFEQEMQIQRDKTEREHVKLIQQYKDQVEELRRSLTHQSERSKIQESDRQEIDRELQNLTEELKKERQLTTKLKAEIRSNSEEYDLNLQKQQALSLKIQSELKSQLRAQEQELQQRLEVVNHENTKYGKQYQDLQKQHNDMKHEFEKQMALVQEDVSRALQEQRKKILALLERCDYQESDIQQYEENLFKMEQEIKQLQQQKEQLSIQKQQAEEQLQFVQSHNQDLLEQVKLNIRELSLQIQSEKNNQPQQLLESLPESEQLVQSQQSFQQNARQAAYETLLEEILVVEKEACQLNVQYQILFAQFQRGQGSEIRDQMNALMGEIKKNNQTLFELKAKEFMFLS